MIFAPQQFVGLAEGILEGKIPEPHRIVAFFPMDRTLTQYAARTMFATRRELKQILGSGKVWMLPTISGLRSLEIACLVRFTGFGSTKDSVLVSGFPTSGLVERSQIIKRGGSWLLIDDGISSIKPEKYLLNDAQPRRGGRAYRNFVNLVAGRWPTRLVGPIELFTSFGLRESTLTIENKLVKVHRHKFSSLAQSFSNEAQRSMLLSEHPNKILVGTCLRGIPDKYVIDTIVEIVRELSINIYMPHRHEPPRRTTEVIRRTGVTLSPPGLPLELKILQSLESTEFILMPGSAWYTVPQIITTDNRLVLLPIFNRLIEKNYELLSENETVKDIKDIELEFPHQV